MRKIGKNLEYQEPAGWTETTEGTRRMYSSGPNRLTVWTNLLEGSSAADVPPKLREGLLREALQIAQTAATQPNLSLLKPLTQDEEGLCSLPCWTVASRSADETMLFVSAVVQGTSGILYATLEAVLEPASLAIMETFLRSVRENA